MTAHCLDHSQVNMAAAAIPLSFIELQCAPQSAQDCLGDYYGNKRLELSGQLVEVLFEESRCIQLL